MDLIDFYRREQRRLHQGLQEAVSDLTPEEWNYLGEGTGNNIAFLMWHSVRTEDNILRFILQGRPTIWQEGGWHERLGLPPRVQGTGMATSEARAFHIADPPGLYFTPLHALRRNCPAARHAGQARPAHVAQR
jgi:hypothetical protein